MRVDLRNHCGHGKPVSEPCIVCEKMDKIMNQKIHEYEGIIAYVAEWQFLGRETEIEGSETVRAKLKRAA